MPPEEDTLRRESARDRFEQAGLRGERPSLGDFWEAGGKGSGLLRELLAIEIDRRLQAGERPGPGEYLARFPGFEAAIGEAFGASTTVELTATIVRDDAPTLPVTGAGCMTDSVVEVEPDPSPADPSVAEALARAGYEVTGVLGRGGMGIVYEAVQSGLGRSVAIKVLRAGLFAGEDECRRFLHEAEAVGRLNHPAIVPIYEVRGGPGLPFFSMRRIGGAALDRKLEAGPMPIRDAARLVARIARAVDEAHRHGILHRDIKPANILVDADGLPYLTDFGLARRMDGEGPGMTRTGAVMGTPSYMAPEQAEGRIDDLTTATDVFGLGGVLYAAITGRAPHRGSSIALILDQVRKVPPEAPSRINRAIPRDLESVCLKCLEKEPGRRYPSARELADDLDRWLAGKPTVARPVPAFTRARMWAKRNPLPASLASALAAAILIGLAAAGWQWGESLRHRRRAEALLDYLANRMLGQASTEANPYGADLTVRELLDRQAVRIGGEFQGRPELEAPLRETIGGAYHSLGLFDEAEAQLQKALELFRRLEGADAVSSIRVATRLGRMLGDRGDLDRAASLLAEARGRAAKALGPDDPATLEAEARPARSTWRRGKPTRPGRRSGACWRPVGEPFRLTTPTRCDRSATFAAWRSSSRSMTRPNRSHLSTSMASGAPGARIIPTTWRRWRIGA
ncbi:MAG: serine/threonine-protein kinase [Isosphaeraceae bacterium]